MAIEKIFFIKLMKLPDLKRESKMSLVKKVIADSYFKARTPSLKKIELFFYFLSIGMQAVCEEIVTQVSKL